MNRSHKEITLHIMGEGKRDRGTYVLVLKTDGTQMAVGGLGMREFKRGFYLYIGSGMNSLSKRVSRHLKRDKKIHWHIDYLTTTTEFEIYPHLFLIRGKRKEEEEIASGLMEKFNDWIIGFGSSDSSLESHLLFTPNFDPKSLELYLKDII